MEAQRGLYVCNFKAALALAKGPWKRIYATTLTHCVRLPMEHERGSFSSSEPPPPPPTAVDVAFHPRNRCCAVPCSALHAAGVVTCCWRIYPWLGQEPSFKTQSSSLSRRQNLKLRKKNSFVRFANAKKGISPKTLTTATKVFIISSSLYAAILIFMTV